MLSLLTRSAAAQKPMLIAKSGSKYLLMSQGWAIVRVAIFVCVTCVNNTGACKVP